MQLIESRTRMSAAALRHIMQARRGSFQPSLREDLGLPLAVSPMSLRRCRDFDLSIEAIGALSRPAADCVIPPRIEGCDQMDLDGRLLRSDISVMTETTDKKKLPAVVERFILHWGDMGDGWGVNRSVSQIHGLLYLADEPMTAEDIAETLGMARSNVSNSLKELLSWNLIRRVPILGDRRDHFEAETDIWEVAARIAAGRKEREIDPAIAALRACVSDAADDPTITPVASKRLKEMLAFTELVDRWYTQMLKVPRPRLVALVRLGEKIVSYLPTGNPTRRGE
jgi:DNA-binding transcriptional regulator GbsR (MarR family)